MPQALLQNPLAKFMNSKFIHMLIGLLVLANAIVLGWMTFEPKDSELYQKLHHIDTIILYTFVVEIVLRIVGNGVHFFRSSWNIFDFLVIFSAFIPFPNPAHREMVRALRVLRLFYFVEISKKLKHVFGGLMKALPGLVSVVFISIAVFYMFSIVGVAFMGSKGVPEFADLAKSADTLFQFLTMDDWHALFLKVLPVQPYAGYFFYTYFVVMVFVVLNLFVGVIVGALQNAESDLENQTVSDDDKHEEILKELKALKTAVSKASK